MSTNCSEAQLKDLEEVSTLCVGDVCFRVRKCEAKPIVPCQPTEAQECPWKEFSKELGSVLGVSKTWAIVAPNCMIKSIACPFERAIKALQHSYIPQEEQKSSSSCSAATAAVYPWCYPRISFTTDAHIALCEKAIGVHGRAPFIALLDVKNQTALVQDATKYCGSTGADEESPCTKEDFRLICEEKVNEFTEKASRGQWPKALLGEKPPLNDRAEAHSHIAGMPYVHVATQSTFDRLVTGKLTRLCDVLQDARLKEKGEPSIRPEHPVLALAVLWGPQCPCCRPVITVLHRLVQLLSDPSFIASHPGLKDALGASLNVRLVALNAESNDVPEHLWADAETHTLPTILGFRHGEQVPHFRGVRSSRKLVKYVVHHLLQIQQFHKIQTATPQASPMLQASSPPPAVGDSEALEPLNLSANYGSAAASMGASPNVPLDPFPLPVWGEALVRELELLDETTDDSIRKRSRVDS